MPLWPDGLAWTLLLVVLVPSLLVLLHPVWIELARTRARRRARGGGEWAPAVSLAVPLARTEEHGAENARSYLGQRGMGAYEVIAVAEDPGDPSLTEFRALAARTPEVHAVFASSGSPRGRIAKMHNLRRALPLCRHELIVFIDSDVRLPGPFDLQRLVQPLADPKAGLVTAAPLYRAPSTPGGLLMATMINADLWAYFALLSLSGNMNVANGALIATRREVLDEIHAFDDLQHQLLNDTALARKVRGCGYEVHLAADPATIPTPSLSMGDWWRQVMRWHIGMRNVLPRGEYVLYGWHRSPMLLGLIGFFLFAAWPPHALFLLVPACARIVSGAAIHLRWLREPQSAGQVLLAVGTDLLSPLVWLLSWRGGTVEWKGRVYRIREGGVAEEVGHA